MDHILDIAQFLIDYVASIGLIGGFLIIILESIIPIIPLSVFIGINVYNFGNIMGFLMSYVATLIGCILAFTIVKYLIKKNWKWINTNEKVIYYMDKFTSIKLSILVLIIALPFTPAFAVNIAAGLSNINFKKYLIALLIGKLSTIYFWGYIGTGLIESVKHPSILLKVALILFGAHVICKIIQKIFNIKE